jgi:superfamily II DNA/RNA helicase
MSVMLPRILLAIHCVMTDSSSHVRRPPSFCRPRNPEEMIRGLEELGIVTPTEVQKKVIPFLLTDGSDLIAQAQTAPARRPRLACRC